MRAVLYRVLRTQAVAIIGLFLVGIIFPEIRSSCFITAGVLVGIAMLVGVGIIAVDRIRAVRKDGAS